MRGIKTLIAAFVLTVAILASPSGVAYAAKDDDNVKVTICHATNSYKNPYTVNTVDSSSIDEENNKYLNGHGDHTGPVFFPGIPKHTKWGDIIPPFDHGDSHFPGYNWTAEGQAIYRAECTIPEEETRAIITVAVVCDVPNTSAVVTLTNTGNADGEATVNGNVVAVAAGETKEVVVDTDADGTNITVSVDGQTVYDQTLTCEPGKGTDKPDDEDGETLGTVVENTPTTLPHTGSNNALVAGIAVLTAAFAAGVSALRRATSRGL